MMRDRLFLLRPGFEDPAYPGRRFYCWHCVLIEGLLASFPQLAERLDVERIVPYPDHDAAIARIDGAQAAALGSLARMPGGTPPRATS